MLTHLIVTFALPLIVMLFSYSSITKKLLMDSMGDKDAPLRRNTSNPQNTENAENTQNKKSKPFNRRTKVRIRRKRRFNYLKKTFNYLFLNSGSIRIALDFSNKLFILELNYINLFLINYSLTHIKFM